MEKSVLVPAASVAVILLELDVRDRFIAWSPIQGVTLVDTHLRRESKCWTRVNGLKMGVNGF